LTEIPDLETLRAWDRAHVWHPFTPHSVYAGEGNYLIDAEGRRYLDGVASIWCNLFGHRKSEIDEAIRQQLGRIAHSTFLGNAGAPAVELAHRLIELAPEGLTRVFYSDNGSTAVEVALKMALQYWRQSGTAGGEKRSKFLALENAYHGDTVGAVSVGGIDLFHARFGPLLFETFRAPSPYCYRCPVGKDPETCHTECLEEFERTLRIHSEEIAAVVLEPGFQGAGGIVPFPEGYLKKVRELTEEVGTLLILDEVASGMGRSGKMFVCEKEGVVPDFLCIAKGLTGGYLPLAATLTTERVFEAFKGPPEEGRTFFHGHTYTGNALGAAAALATLDLFESEKVFEELPSKIELFRQKVSEFSSLPCVGDTRQYGLAAGIELVADKEAKEPFPASERMGMKVCRACVAKGVFLRPLGDTIVLMPPLSIAHAEIDQLTEVVAESIVEIVPTPVGKP
jgi:adenosylmethionine-8-amino-7-oxononanoate aminotransferase